jgi:hypothetical protein
MTRKSRLSDDHYALTLLSFGSGTFTQSRPESGWVKLVHQSVPMLKGDLPRTFHSSVLSIGVQIPSNRDPDGGGGGQVREGDTHNTHTQTQTNKPANNNHMKFRQRRKIQYESRSTSSEMLATQITWDYSRSRHNWTRHSSEELGQQRRRWCMCDEGCVWVEAGVVAGWCSRGGVVGSV